MRRSSGFRTLLATVALVVPGVASAAPSHAATPPDMAWTRPVAIGQPTYPSATPIVVDRDGNVTVVWRNSEPVYAVMAARYLVASRTWTAPVQIGTDRDTSILSPAMGVDGSGNVTVVWDEGYTGTRDHVLQAARFEASTGTWSAAVDVSGGEPNHMAALFAQVSVSASGDATAVWQQAFGKLQASHYAATTRTWTAPVDLLATNGANATVVSDAAGNAVASWSVYDTFAPGGVSVVQTARFDVGSGTWGATTTLTDPTANAKAVTMSGRADGDVTLAFQVPSGPYSGTLRTTRYDAVAGTWGAPTDLLASPNTVSALHLGTTTAGDVLAVWCEYGRIGWARKASDSPTWPAPQAVSTQGIDCSRGGVDLAVRDDGAAVAGWTAHGTPPYVTTVSIFDPDALAWSAPTELSTTTAIDVAPLSVALDRSGRATAVWGWQDPVTLAKVLRSSRFDTAGPGFITVPPARVFDTRPGESPDALRTVTKAKVGGATVLEVQLTDLPGGLTPSTGVGAVSLNVTVTNPDAAGFLTVYPCGTRPFVSSANYTTGQTVANAVIAPLSPNGTLCFYASNPTDIIADINGWFPTDVGLTTVTPARILDTRPGESPDALRTVTKAKVGGATVLEVQLTDLPGGLTPSTGVGAVSLNVTVTNPDAAGFLTVYPCGTRPFVSSANYTTGQTVANAVIAPLSPNGTLCFYASNPTDIIADINGWFPTDVGLTTVTPARILDTRPGESPDALRTVTKAKVGGATVLEVQLTDLPGGLTPSTGVGAVSLNVTVTNPDAAGFLTVYPCGTRPFVSSANYTTGQTVANAVIAPLSPNGTLCFYASNPTDIIADINGWFAR